MSPRIFPVARRAPSQLRAAGAGVAGRISAMGWPKRVTRKGRPVLRTRSKVARQVALNFEIAMDSMQQVMPRSINLVSPRRPEAERNRLPDPWSQGKVR
jgi:hypothetical protein